MLQEGLSEGQLRLHELVNAGRVHRQKQARPPAELAYFKVTKEQFLRGFFTDGGGCVEEELGLWRLLEVLAVVYVVLFAINVFFTYFAHLYISLRSLEL